MTEGFLQEWSERGLGTLTLRRAADAPSSVLPYIIFTMESGRIAVNAALYRGLVFQRVWQPPCATRAFQKHAARHEHHVYACEHRGSKDPSCHGLK